MVLAVFQGLAILSRRTSIPDEDLIFFRLPHFTVKHNFTVKDILQLRIIILQLRIINF